METPTPPTEPKTQSQLLHEQFVEVLNSLASFKSQIGMVTSQVKL